MTMTGRVLRDFHCDLLKPIGRNDLRLDKMVAKSCGGVIGGNVLQRGANARGHHFGRFDFFGADIENTNHQIFALGLGKNSRIHARGCALD